MSDDLPPARPRLTSTFPYDPAKVTDPLAGKEPEAEPIHLTTRQRIAFWWIKRKLERGVEKMPINWRTTLGGVVAFVYALSAAGKALLDSDPGTRPDWNLVLVAAGALIGLLHAKDRNVTGGTIHQ